MPIRAKCDNCGKVYNVPETSAGKRLRCKQCAVVFTVPSGAAPVAAAAPTVSVTVPAVQKVCVVCGQDVAGKPRTKDQAGNYYCKACYEEKARAREQVAVPAGVGGGDGGEGGDMIDLAALEGVEADAGEQLDYSNQPPPPPIPDMDMVAPPIPDMEPEVFEAPKPKKKKKKKAAVVAEPAGGDSFMSKMMALPIELWIVGVSVILAILGAASSTLAGFAFMGLVLIGIGCSFWGQICIVMTAFAEGTLTGLMYLFVPFYPLIFLMSNWDAVRRHFLRAVLGLAIIIGGGIFMASHGDKGDRDGRQGTSARRVRPAGGQEGAAPMSDSSAANPDSSAAKPDAAAAAEPVEDDSIRLGINLKAFEFEFDDDDLETREEGISDAILGSFQQRGLKPPEGQYWRVEAVLEPNLSSTRMVKNAKLEDVPGPVLICKLRVKDSIGRGNYIFDQAKTIEIPAEMAPTFYRLDSEAIDKALWKTVPREFKALADMFAPAGAAAPAGANPAIKPPASGATPAPAK